MRMAYRDAGFWTSVYHAVSSVWKHGHTATYPPKGFVGLVCSSSQVTDRRPHKLTSIALRRLPCTRDGQLWRLTYGWEISPPASRIPRFGERSAEPGRHSSPELDGAETSASRIGTISTSDGL